MPSDLRLLMGGLKSLIPLPRAPRSTGGTVDPTYCYAVWLRHLRMIANAGIDPVRETVVELGPGDSIGTGFTALLTTAQRYIALDVVPHAAEGVQTRLFDAVEEMLRSRAEIPDASAFPDLYPRLRSHEFPSDLLTPAMMETALEHRRVATFRKAITQMAAGDDRSPIRYSCPWSPRSVSTGSVDLVFSQAVLQEIDNRGSDGALRRTFAAMAMWLKPGGVISHQIDLGMYGAKPWDRHWTYGDARWAIIRGRRVNYINREPLSTYEGLCADLGFEIALLDVVPGSNSVPRRKLARRFQSLSERDRSVKAVHLVAVKRG